MQSSCQYLQFPLQGKRLISWSLVSDLLMEFSFGCRSVPCCGTHTDLIMNASNMQTRACASVYMNSLEGAEWKLMERERKSKRVERGRVGGSKMKACLTIFTDVPFSPAGGCLLLLFLTQHQSEEGQQKPVDRKRKHTHSEQKDTISIQLWLGHKSPWLIRSQTVNEA